MHTDRTDPYCQYYFQTDDGDERKKRYTEKWFAIIQHAEKRKQTDIFFGDNR